MANSYEEAHIHHDLTWEEYLALPKENRISDDIYFIKDLNNDSQLIQILINKMDKLISLLEEKKGDN